MDPMLKRRLHIATFFVFIALALMVTLFRVSSWLYRLIASLTYLVTAVMNGLRSWTLTDSDSHHHMTSMTLAPHQPTSTVATAAMHHWTFTECGIGMVILVTILVCISVIATRSLGKIPIDVTHIYTWKLSRHYDKTDDSAPALSSPMPPSSPTTEKVTADTTSPPLQALVVSTGIIPAHNEKQSPTSSSVVEMPSGTACSSPAISTSTMIMPTTKTDNDILDGAQMGRTQKTGTAEEPTTTVTTTTIATSMEKATTLATTTTTIDKRRKKRNKQGKRKDRGKQVLAMEQHSKEQQQRQVLRTKPGDANTEQPQTQKMSVKTSPQSTILVPPSPPRPPCDDHRRSSTSPVAPTPPAHGVTQEHFSVKPAMSTTSSRSPPSPAVSPNDRHPTKKKSTMTESPPLTPTPHQPMVTKFISNKKDTLPPTATSQIPPTKAFTSFSSTPSPPSSSSHTTAGISSRQSWYSPFNTGLEFDLLSRSPPSPTHTYISASTSSSPSLSVTSSTFSQNDYRLFSDPPSSRPPSSSTIPPCIGGYSHHLQQHQQQQQQVQAQQQTHQLHQHQPHSQTHSHSSLPLQQYQHRHPHHTCPIQQQQQHHHHFQQPSSQLYHTSGGNTYDHFIYGSLPTPTPPLSAAQKTISAKSPSTIGMESYSSIADIPPPLTSARLPTPPVSLSPVIAPPTLPPPPSSSSISSVSSALSSTGEPISSSTSSSSSASKSPSGIIPLSWYQWKPRSSATGSLSPTLYHQQQQQHQESICHGNTNDINEHQPPQSFSLFDRKLPFHASGGGRFHGASSSQR